MASPFPGDWMELTHILVVADIARGPDVLPRRPRRRPCTASTAGRHACSRRSGRGCCWSPAVARPTADKPTVTFAAPADPETVSHAMTIRVPDSRGATRRWSSAARSFLAPPVESDWEIRGFFRDPDGHLLEISEAKAAG